MKRLQWALLALLAVFAITAAAADDYVDSRGVLSVIAHAPAKARNQQNPLKEQPDAVAAGDKLFHQHCAECHGDDARGRYHAADLRAPAVQGATDGELFWFLRSGNVFHGMPAWGGLPEARRWQIVSYLKSLGAAPAPASVRVAITDATGSR